MFEVDGKIFVTAFLDKGITLTDFIRQTGLSQVTANKFLRGDKVNAKSLTRAAKFLGVTPTHLLKEDKNENQIRCRSFAQSL